jgi:hypothetical protein
VDLWPKHRMGRRLERKIKEDWHILRNRLRNGAVLQHGRAVLGLFENSKPGASGSQL